MVREINQRIFPYYPHNINLGVSGVDISSAREFPSKSYAQLRSFWNPREWTENLLNLVTKVSSPITERCARMCVRVIAQARCADADRGIWSPELLSAPLILVLFINWSCPYCGQHIYFLASSSLMRWPLRGMWRSLAGASVPHLLPTTVRYSISCLVRCIVSSLIFSLVQQPLLGVLCVNWPNSQVVLKLYRVIQCTLILFKISEIGWWLR